MQSERVNSCCNKFVVGDYSAFVADGEDPSWKYVSIYQYVNGTVFYCTLKDKLAAFKPSHPGDKPKGSLEAEWEIKRIEWEWSQYLTNQSMPVWKFHHSKVEKILEVLNG